jgi:hypothetical protein
LRLNLITHHALGYLPVQPARWGLAILPAQQTYECTSVIITTNISFSEHAKVFGNVRMTTAPLHRLTRHCQILETGMTVPCSTQALLHQSTKGKITRFTQVPHCGTHDYPDTSRWKSRVNSQR